MSARKKFIVRGVLGLIVAAWLFMPVRPAVAFTSAELQQYLNNILTQLQLLREKLQTEARTITSDLFYGLRANAQVQLLHEFLIAKGYLEDGLATGNFFNKTLVALKQFQKDNNIPATGYYGLLTRARVTQLMTSSASSPVRAIQPRPTTTVAVGVLPAPTSTQDLAGLAHAIQDRINDVRAQNERGLLTWDDRLAVMAQLHSEDQALDNAPLTNPALLCNYPLIRHEEFGASSIGYSLRDRLEHERIDYRLAGENIAMVPLATNLVYQYRADNPPAPCPVVPDYPPQDGPREQREALYNDILAQARHAVAGLPTVQFVNKEWLTPEQVVGSIVTGWMNSPGHRRNILEPVFTAGGIGIARVNDYIIVTHNFLRP